MRSLALPQGAVPPWHQRLQKTWEKKCRVSQVTLSLCKALAVNHRTWKKLRPLCIQLYLLTFVHFDLTFKRRSESGEAFRRPPRLWRRWTLVTDKTPRQQMFSWRDFHLSAGFVKFSRIGMNKNQDCREMHFFFCKGRWHRRVSISESKWKRLGYTSRWETQCRGLQDSLVLHRPLDCLTSFIFLWNRTYFF